MQVGKRALAVLAAIAFLPLPLFSQTATLVGTFTAPRTVTLPDNSGTVAELNYASTWSATQTFASIVITGSCTGCGGGGSGTVTSVALSLPGDFSVSGSPITTSGTLTVSWATETANTFLAGPTSGAAAAPTWRGLVAADVIGGTGTVGAGNGVLHDLAVWTDANTLNVSSLADDGAGHVTTASQVSATGGVLSPGVGTASVILGGTTAATAAGTNETCLGAGCAAGSSGGGSTVVGEASASNVANCTALGQGITCSNANAIDLGAGAIDNEPYQLTVEGVDSVRYVAGHAPTIGAGCGGGSTITGSNAAPTVTVGTGSPTSCTINFGGSGWHDAPNCSIVSSTDSFTWTENPSTSSVAFTSSAGLTSGSTLRIQCSVGK